MRPSRSVVGDAGRRDRKRGVVDGDHAARMRIVAGARDVDGRLRRASDVGQCGCHPLHQRELDRRAVDVQVERVLLRGRILSMRAGRRGLLESRHRDVALRFEPVRRRLLETRIEGDPAPFVVDRAAERVEVRLAERALDHVELARHLRRVVRARDFGGGVRAFRTASAGAAAARRWRRGSRSARSPASCLRAGRTCR